MISIKLAALFSLASSFLSERDMLFEKNLAQMCNLENGLDSTVNSFLCALIA